MKNLINNFNYNQNNDFYSPITNINIINTIKNIIGEFNTNKMYIPEENYMLYDVAINEYNFFNELNLKKRLKDLPTNIY